MIVATIDFHFSGHDLPLLKKACELHLRQISPTLRLELLARWCGFSSMAALRASLSDPDRDVRITIDTSSAAAFAASRSISFEPRMLFEVLASAVMPKVARENPLLHNWGYGLGCLEPRRDERQKLIAGLPVEEWRPAIERAIQQDLRARREELLKVEPQSQFLQALAFVSCIKPIKTQNTRRSSYGLKHVAEKLDFSVEGVRIAEPYISNTDLIAAALYAGFRADAPHYVGGQFNNSPNPSFNMSERSIKPLVEERQKRRLAA